MGRNLEVYIDDIMLKFKNVDMLPQDMREIFSKICPIGMKLNPKKCIFGVLAVKCLGFTMSERGIEANLEKIIAIQDMPPP